MTPQQKDLILNALRIAAEQIRPTDDVLWDKTLSDRDDYQEWADKLANAISEHLDIDIGEHSNANNPWQNALDAIQSQPYKTIVDDLKVKYTRVLEPTPAPEPPTVTSVLTDDDIRSIFRNHAYPNNPKEAADNLRGCRAIAQRQDALTRKAVIAEIMAQPSKN